MTYIEIVDTLNQNIESKWRVEEDLDCKLYFTLISYLFSELKSELSPDLNSEILTNL